LTRQSIIQKAWFCPLARTMDARVKPAHDDRKIASIHRPLTFIA
jgi:hypothetical protein